MKMNYILIWAREYNMGFMFMEALNDEDAINRFMSQYGEPNESGKLNRLIITETSNTYKVPIELYYE